jgi:hypothetical protein
MVATSFWYQAALNAVAPLVTAVFGLLIAGIAVNFLARILQDRRAANELKHELISQMTETASTLYHYIGLYGRAKADAELYVTHEGSREENMELSELRKSLQKEYVTGRAQAEVIEARLAAYFDESRVSVAWHAVIDCLSVRYYNAVGGPQKVLDEVYYENVKGWEGRYHTGLLRQQPFIG